MSQSAFPMGIFQINQSQTPATTVAAPHKPERRWELKVCVLHYFATFLLPFFCFISSTDLFYQKQKQVEENTGKKAVVKRVPPPSETRYVKPSEIAKAQQRPVSVLNADLSASSANATPAAPALRHSFRQSFREEQPTESDVTQSTDENSGGYVPGYSSIPRNEYGEQTEQTWEQTEEQTDENFSYQHPYTPIPRDEQEQQQTETAYTPSYTLVPLNAGQQPSSEVPYAMIEEVS
jgi:hypothetical protein